MTKDEFLEFAKAQGCEIRRISGFVEGPRGEAEDTYLYRETSNGIRTAIVPSLSSGVSWHCFMTRGLCRQLDLSWPEGLEDELNACYQRFRT